MASERKIKPLQDLYRAEFTPPPPEEKSVVPASPAGRPAVFDVSFETVVRAECDLQIATAKAYPMHSDLAGLKRFQDQATAIATSSREVAASCIYHPPRAGGAVEGPSVRFAEIVAGAFGNLRIASRIVQIDQATVTAQGICFDLERNIARTTETQRSILDRDGRRYNADMISKTCGAACSIAARNAILQVIGLALCHPIYEKAKKAALPGKDEDVGQWIAKLLVAFSALGITQAQILHKCGVDHLAKLSQEHRIMLLGIYNAIQSGDETVGSQFGIGPPRRASEAPDKAGGEAIADAAAVDEELDIV